MEVVKAGMIGFVLDIYILICVFVAPITLFFALVYWAFSRRKRRKEDHDQKCIVCKKDKRSIDDDGICTTCNAGLDEIYDSLNGEPAEPQESQGIPWMSIEVVPAGMPKKELVDIDIRIDFDTGLPYTVENGIYREIGGDM